MEVNGKIYPLWGQFVDGKEKFVGGILQDLDMGECHETEITDIVLKPNGETSAFFRVEGKDFCCGFDVSVGGISGGETGWLTFIGYAGHTWRIKGPPSVAEETRRNGG